MFTQLLIRQQYSVTHHGAVVRSGQGFDQLWRATGDQSLSRPLRHTLWSSGGTTGCMLVPWKRGVTSPGLERGNNGQLAHLRFCSTHRRLPISNPWRVKLPTVHVVPPGSGLDTTGNPAVSFVWAATCVPTWVGSLPRDRSSLS